MKADALNAIDKAVTVAGTMLPSVDKALIQAALTYAEHEVQGINELKRQPRKAPAAKAPAKKAPAA